MKLVKLFRENSPKKHQITIIVFPQTLALLLHHITRTNH